MKKRDLTDGNSERGERFVVVEVGSSGVQRIRNAFVAGIRDENGLDKGQCNPFRFAEAGRRLPLRYCGCVRPYPAFFAGWTCATP
ncbi:MAG: hypothetical protein EOS11_21560 [Mesorhizobium sp.]|uniref:hypothetical protein n=1 Tax=Mesorhizobium sp. TaxID=1871066 RepID=UPI000FE30FB4|nr:hypothetical protein [Mesorhizobium sp.]RWO39677.1 MAG: hypothetical protein EOS11_21560 [Mesorhizobium sp.]TIN79885.1 MAG: hypothetical protein E5Y09_05535 [Mesorhizobium sp.]